ncbi:MAG: hypothetical protein R3B70_01975 [Polyangiaceae bacterium]
MISKSACLRACLAASLFASGCSPIPPVGEGAKVIVGEGAEVGPNGGPLPGVATFEPEACSFANEPRATQPRIPGGALLIDSEEAFKARYQCFDAKLNVVEKSSGVDFSKDVIVVFAASGDAVAPKLERVERAGDKLTAVFGLTSYCGGAPPPVITTVSAFVVKKAALTLETKSFTYSHERCPSDLP